LETGSWGGENALGEGISHFKKLWGKGRTQGLGQYGTTRLRYG